MPRFVMPNRKILSLDSDLRLADNKKVDSGKNPALKLNLWESPMDTKFAFFQGQIVPIEQAKVSVMTHALNYGTAVFAGIRAYWNADDEQLYIFRLADHYARLQRSARLLMMEIPYTFEQFQDILIDLLRHENYQQN